jgi:hypothetical protein
MEDYLADSLLHGLKTLVGEDVVDAPRRDSLYRDFTAERRARIYGCGFTLYGMLEDAPVDRERPFERAAAGEFDLVVVGDVWRRPDAWRALAPLAGRVDVAVLDGGDYPRPWPYGRRAARHLLAPRPWRRARFFKRELTPVTERWARAGSVHEIAFSVPAEKVISDADGDRPNLLSRHVVDEEVAAAVGRAGTGYAFATEREYYDDLRSARFAVTVRRAGWDALRHYEIAANGAIPCFRDLGAKPTRCAPHGLSDGVNCVAYGSAEELLARLKGMPAGVERELRAGALEWARANTTSRRAAEFLSRASSR